MRHLKSRLGDGTNGRLKKELIHPNRDGTLYGLDFSPDGKRLIAGDIANGTVVVWDVATGKEVTTIETGSYRRRSLHLLLSPDWQTLFVPRQNRKVEAVQENGKRLRRWQMDGDVRAFDLATGQLRRSYKHEPPRGVLHMRLSADRARFLTQALKLFDLATGQEKISIPIKDKNVWCGFPSFSPDGRVLVGNYRMFERANQWKQSQTWIKWWDRATGAEIGSFTTQPKNQGLFFRYSPDKKMLVALDWSGEQTKLFLFRGPDRKPTKTLILAQREMGERTAFPGLLFTPDGKWLVVCTKVIPDTRNDEDLDVQDLKQPRIHLIDLTAGEIRETLIAPQSFGQSMCVSPDGKTLATVGRGRVLVWDLANLP
jgi:WD40 repeat protein